MLNKLGTIALLVPLFALVVTAAPKNIGDYYEITTSGDTACLNECTSYIWVTKNQTTHPSDSFNTSIVFEFQNLRYTRTKTKGANVFKGSFSDQELGYEVLLKTGETCMTEEVQWENGTLQNVTACSDTSIPFDQTLFLQQIQNVGNTATIVLKGYKSQTDSAKWGIRIGDVYIDPLWQGIFGYPYFGSDSIAQVSLDSETDAVGMAFSLNRPENVTGVYVKSGTAQVGSPPIYRYGIQFDNETSTKPNRTWVGGDDKFTELNKSYGTTWAYVSFQNNYSLDSGKKYWLVVEYATGPINTSNDLVFQRISTELLSSIDKGFRDKDLFNATMKSASTTNNGTWNLALPIGEFLINTSRGLYGKPISASLGSSSTTGDDIVWQNFSTEGTYVVNNITVEISSVSSANCTVKVSIIQGNLSNSSWKEQEITGCSLNVLNTSTTNTYTCQPDNSTTLYPNTEYTLVGYSIDCASTRNFKRGSVASNGDYTVDVEEESWGGKNFTAWSSTNNGTSKVNLGSDFVFMLEIEEIFVGNVNVTWSSPTADANHANNSFVAYTVNVTCTGGVCGDASAYLDPLQLPGREEVLYCAAS